MRILKSYIKSFHISRFERISISVSQNFRENYFENFQCHPIVLSLKKKKKISSFRIHAELSNQYKISPTFCTVRFKTKICSRVERSNTYDEQGTAKFIAAAVHSDLAA